MKDNKNNMIDELLIRYLEGIASENERIELDKWVKQQDENAQYFNKIKSVWEKSAGLKSFQQIDTESSLKNVKKRIGFKEANKRKIQPLWIAVRIAAIVILFFGIYSIFRQKDEAKSDTEFTRIESGNELKTFTLPDSTIVSLNKESQLAYFEDFNKKERRIKFEGEAYFEVKPDKQKPFIIETNRSETKVLGTAFNLKAYSGSGFESIVVTHGLVEFSEKTGNSKQKVLLEKGEKATLANELTKEMNYDLNFMSWKTGILIFNNEALPSAFKVLSEYYKTEFVIGDSRLNAYRISGKYEKLELDAMLEVLEMTLGVKSEKDNGKVWIRTLKSVN
jgi:ferric-dicitrate binding protein FerR (iron transport regulator)